MKRYEQIVQGFWCVSKALRHPEGDVMLTGDALRRLNAGDRLRPEEWRLRELIHVVRFDIIEGNTSWRPEQLKNGSISTLSTTK